MLQSLCTPTIFFFFNDTATTEIYTLSLHDALPISSAMGCADGSGLNQCARASSDTLRRDMIQRLQRSARGRRRARCRSEEHTSELQSRLHLVCRLLLEKKKG